MDPSQKEGGREGGGEGEGVGWGGREGEIPQGYPGNHEQHMAWKALGVCGVATRLEARESARA